MMNNNTKILGVIGNPIAHSMSPLIHNSAIKELGLNFTYFAFKVENIGKAIDGLRELGLRGISVTIPHKETIIPFLDKIDSLAEKIGAVNTVVNEEGSLLGYNTDCIGAINALKKETSLNGKKAYIIGAGGAARAIVAGLVEEKSNVKIFGREGDNQKKLAEEFSCKYGLLEEINKEYDILVNATPVGMFPNTEEMIVSENLLNKESLIFDVVYNPIETFLIKKAKKKGCKTILGIEMFLEQAYEQFKLFTKNDPPKEEMRRVLLEQLNE